MSTLTIDLPPDADKRLRDAAAERGQTREELAAFLLAAAIHDMGRLPASSQADGDEAARLAAIDAAYGAFADLPGSVDDFLRGRQQEAEGEERRERENWERFRRGRSR